MSSEPTTPATEENPGSTRDPVSPVTLGAKLFEWRDFTPIPLLLVLLIIAEPTAESATLGLVSMVIGEIVRIYGVAFIGSVSRTRNIETTGKALITSGPFAIVRNPLYVGNLFLALGFAIYSGHLWFVALTFVAFTFQYYCIVKYEETLLLDRFGETYQAYMDRVPAWIPSRLPDIEDLEWPDTFSKALRSERKTLGAILVLLVLMLTIT